MFSRNLGSPQVEVIFQKINNLDLSDKYKYVRLYLPFLSLLSMLHALVNNNVLLSDVA